MWWTMRLKKWVKEPCPYVTLKGVKESDKQQKESPPIEPGGSEQAPLHSKLSLRGESRCSWIYS